MHEIPQAHTHAFINLQESDASGPSQTLTFFAIFSLPIKHFVAVYDACSMEMCELMEHTSVWSSDTSCGRGPHTSLLCTPVNSAHARRAHRMGLKRTIQAWNGGPYQAARQCLAAMPPAAQTAHTCPLLDVETFAYDARVVTYAKRAGPCPEFPFHFFWHSSGSLAWSLTADHVAPSHDAAWLRIVFHPTEPLVLVLHVMAYEDGLLECGVHFRV
jgi:hypothetical protein